MLDVKKISRKNWIILTRYSENRAENIKKLLKTSYKKFID